jgi:Spx/MgsR family transcriptional regulator
MAAAKPRFIWKKTCSTCRNARAFLADLGIEAEEREINASPLTAPELDLLIGRRDHRDFLNTRNELYREHKMKQDPPTRAQALALIAEHPNLLKRPVLISKGRVILGFDQAAWKEMLS